MTITLFMTSEELCPEINSCEICFSAKLFHVAFFPMKTFIGVLPSALLLKLRAIV